MIYSQADRDFDHCEKGRCRYCSMTQRLQCEAEVNQREEHLVKESGKLAIPMESGQKLPGNPGPG